MMKQIGVILVTYNNGSKIQPFLDSLSSQTYPNFHLFIVDNSSMDDTIKYIQDKIKVNGLSNKTTIIQNSQNYGFAKAVNTGIKQALKLNNLYTIVLINPDTKFDTQLFKAGIDTLNKHPQAGACSPIILYPDNKIWWMGSRIFKSKEILFGTKYSIAEHINKGKKFNFHLTQVQEVEALSGCIMFINVKAIQKVGLLDEKYFMYAEDIDFSLRLKQAGFKLYIFPGTKFFHLVKDKQKDLKTIASSLRKYKIYLTSVGKFLNEYHSRSVLIVWLMKLPMVLIYNYLYKK